MEQEFYNAILITLVILFFYLYTRAKNNRILEKTVKISAFPIVFTELYDNIILAYNDKTHDFVCQGKNLQEVVDNLKYRKINEAFLIHDKTGSNKLYFIKNGTLKLLTP